MIPRLFAVSDPDTAGKLRWNLIGLIAEAVLTGAGFALLIPLLEALLVNDIANAWFCLGLLMGLLILYAMIRYGTQISGYHVSIGLGRVLFDRLSQHMMKLPVGWFHAGRLGQIGRLTSQGVIDVIGVPAHLMRPIVSGIVTPVTVVILITLFDWRLALATAASAPFLWMTARLAGRLTDQANKRADDASAEAAGRIVEFAQLQAVLRAFGHAQRGYRQLDLALREQRDAGRALMLRAALGLSAFVVALQLVFTALLILSANWALGGTIDAPELVALLVLVVRYVEPLIGAAALSGAVRASAQSLDRIETLLETHPLPETGTPKSPAGNQIDFQTVSFAYGEDHVLKDVSFTAPERAVTAIVGPSGAGKTTILRLISRFWDVTNGAVRIGGTDIREISSEDLMSRVSMVFQDVYLFQGTIAQNIRIGRPDASDDEVRRAARLARVTEFTERLPRGLASQVGEGGSALSGGERQRVSIARAILKDAPIILLDEATSALDPLSDLAIQQALRVLTQDKTLIVVAHRLQTVRDAQQILVLDRGTVCESGTHSELIANDGLYAKFWTERERSMGWRLGRS